ncbi:MAG TPA: hypothetical protein VH020_11595 [Stellaceae bacterium]|jgi:hypothetical protein|nr:hypothetical protein [Stellaceae bacterium]
MTEFTPPIVIRYDGLDAAKHKIDLALLGDSLKGGARLLAVAGHLALTGEYVSKLPAMSVRVLASPPRGACYEIHALIVASTPLLPYLTPAAQSLLKKAIEGTVSFMLARLSNKPTEAATAMDLAMAAIASNHEVTLKNIDLAKLAIEKAADNQRPAAQAFAIPVGTSVATALIGEPDSAFIVDSAARAQIDQTEPVEIGDTQTYTVRLSELDVQTGSCKVAIHGDDTEARYDGLIADPVVKNPHSAYSAALDSQTWIKVMAKPHVREGQLRKLTISDTGR